MQPFDYTIRQADPGDVFLQGWQIGQAIKQQRVAQEQQQQQKRMAERMQQALGMLRPDSGAAEFAGVVQQFPDLVDPLTKQYGAFDTARKTALFDAGSRAFTLLQPGAEGMGGADAAVADLEQSALAFENSNQPGVAKQLRDAAKGVKMNPGAARQTLGMLLAFSDPDKFKKIGDGMGKAEDTAFQRDYAFIKGQFGQEAADKFANTKIDETAMIPLPGGRVYVGPRSGIAAAMSGAPVAPTSGPRVGTIEDGYRFKGGDPANPQNWEKVR